MHLIQSILSKIFFSSGAEDRERELKQLKKNVRKTMSAQTGDAKGIGDIVFTVGKEETKAFQEKNEALREVGEPHYIRVKKDIGSKELIVVVWIKLVNDKNDIITDLVMGSTKPNHQHFFFGDRENYQIIVHPQMRGIRAAEPTFCLWIKKDSNKSRHICDLKISYTKDEWTDLKRKNYEMLPLCLSQFGLAYAQVWILWAPRKVVRLRNSNHIEKELMDYNSMLKSSPDNLKLLQMVESANTRLREAHFREEDYAKDISSDDLTYTKQFLGLKQFELDKMCYIFLESIDVDRDGKISIEDYITFLKEPLTIAPFVQQIFALSSTNDKEHLHQSLNRFDAPFWDVGSTLKATSVFCMLCSNELLKFIFAWYDEKGFGVIENNDFLKVLCCFHPRHHDRYLKGALHEADISKEGTMSFNTFENLVKSFPHLLYPGFRVQEKMRQIFFGEKFWKQKLDRYAEAKEQIIQEEKRKREAKELERKQRNEFLNALRTDNIQYGVEKVKKTTRKN